MPTENISFGRSARLKDYGVFAQANLIGFRVHTHYFGAEEPYAISCFDSIVQKLYKQTEEYGGSVLS